MHSGVNVIIENETIPVYDFESCLYFSVITWTSLGYGDIFPSDSARLWVMVEVFFGYLHMGILVGVVLDIFASEKLKHPPTNT